MEHTNNDVVDEQLSNASLTDDDDELTESLIKRSSKWPRLIRFIFKYNNLEKIDESIVSTVQCVNVLRL